MLAIHIFIVVLGLIIGSFLTALTYRIAINKSISKGRSICPKCKKKIDWYDNIPVLSYLVLGGRCRSCKKTISVRYPLLELLTSLVFLMVLVSYLNCTTDTNIICITKDYLGMVALPYFLLVASTLLAIFIVDLEHQIIPDLFTFALLLFIAVPFVFIPYDDLYARLVAGVVPALILLALALITKGKGMGLGDVKFALPAGMLVGWPTSLYWLYTAFLTGALVGIILLLGGKASMKSKIAFGPFLVFSLFVFLFFGERIVEYIVL